MAEEHACLVRAYSGSEGSSKLGSFGSLSKTMACSEDRVNRGTEIMNEPTHAINMPTSPNDDHGDGNENGELIDYNDCGVLEQFHEDALRQAGCGIAQCRVLLAAALAVVGAALELAAIPFVLPSAEIELCILSHEKNWLVLISLMGGSLGAVGWGVLSERLGRRRTLLSCLAVNVIFAAVAAVMPTYGTFMMARFCSAIGSGGIVPTCYTYVSEMTSRTCRSRLLAVLLAAAGVGVLLSAALAGAVLPPTGAEALIENKEHFSAWHRYLLLCTLPIIASLISLIWTQESPRYLLDVGREVDAMMAYQSIHSSNQVLFCGKHNVAANNADSEYRLGELALPGKRRPPGLHHVRQSVKMFWQAFFQLFTSYRSTTFTLGGTLLFTTAIQFFLSAYIPITVDIIEAKTYKASRHIVTNTTFVDEHVNQTLENTEYTGVTFRNCVFKDMMMSHVSFRNCTFLNVEFSNIRTSFTTFEDSFFDNSTLIDTDIEVGREMSASCSLQRTVVRGMQLGCGRRADLASRLHPLRVHHVWAAHGTLLAALLAAVLPSHWRKPVLLCAILVLLSPFIYLAYNETTLYAVEAMYIMIISFVYFDVCVRVVETYPACLRCTAHGFLLSVAYMGALLARVTAEESALLSAISCALLGVAATFSAKR